MSPAKGDIRPDRVLRFRLRQADSLAQIQNVLQELHPQT
jgi:hypothetical protein